jgi:hypothetical protein
MGSSGGRPSHLQHTLVQLQDSDHPFFGPCTLYKINNATEFCIRISQASPPDDPSPLHQFIQNQHILQQASACVHTLHSEVTLQPTVCGPVPVA